MHPPEPDMPAVLLTVVLRAVAIYLGVPVITGELLAELVHEEFNYETYDASKRIDKDHALLSVLSSYPPAMRRAIETEARRLISKEFDPRCVESQAVFTRDNTVTFRNLFISERMLISQDLKGIGINTDDKSVETKYCQVWIDKSSDNWTAAASYATTRHVRFMFGPVKGIMQNVETKTRDAISTVSAMGFQYLLNLVGNWVASNCTWKTAVGTGLSLKDVFDLIQQIIQLFSGELVILSYLGCAFTGFIGLCYVFGTAASGAWLISAGSAFMLQMLLTLCIGGATYVLTNSVDLSSMNMGHGVKILVGTFLLVTAFCQCGMSVYKRQTKQVFSDPKQAAKALKAVAVSTMQLLNVNQLAHKSLLNGHGHVFPHTVTIKTSEDGEALELSYDPSSPCTPGNFRGDTGNQRQHFCDWKAFCKNTLLASNGLEKVTNFSIAGHPLDMEAARRNAARLAKETLSETELGLFNSKDDVGMQAAHLSYRQRMTELTSAPTQPDGKIGLIGALFYIPRILCSNAMWLVGM